MFLYLALAASLLGADAKESQFDKALRARHNVDVAGIAKYAKEHRTSSDRRNLRDMIKPDDTVIEFFRDSACSVPMQKGVDHGNTCYKSYDDSDGSVSMVKIGCAVGSDGNLAHEFYDFGMSEDCAGAAEWGPFQVPFWGQTPGVAPGDCVMMPMDDGDDEQMWAKVHCSRKDPLRDNMGFHMLDFEEGQVKECHDHSIKTNRAKFHNFITMGQCISMDEGKSIMAEGDCSMPGKVHYREDETGEHCANLGEQKTHEYKTKCRHRHGRAEREFCVDANTGPQM